MEADKVGGILDIGDHKFTLYVWVVAVLGVNHLSEVDDAGLPPGQALSRVLMWVSQAPRQLKLLDSGRDDT